MKRAALLLATISIFGISCERHSWESTKGLHKHGGGEKHADHAADKAHAGEPGHATPESATHADPAKTGEAH